MEGLKWGREKFSKAKANLLKLGLIEDVQRIGENGRVLGWYISVKFAQNATLGTFNVAEIADNHPTGFPQGGQTRVWESPIQIPITGNEIPSTNKEIQTEASKITSDPSNPHTENPHTENPDSGKPVTTKYENREERTKEEKSNESEFETFYSTYPRKVSKANAERAWKKQKCVLSEVLPSLQKQMKAWNDPQFIPHPATWLNGRRWEDEIPSGNKAPQQSYSTTPSLPSGKNDPSSKKKAWYVTCEERGERESFKTWVINNRPEEWSEYLPSMDVRWWYEFCSRPVEF